MALHVPLFKWRIIVLIWETFPRFLFDGVTHKRKENENFPYFLSDKAPGQEVLRRNCTVKPTYHIVGHFIHLPVSTTALSPMTQINHKYRSKHSNFTFTDVCCAAHERSHLRQKKKKSKLAVYLWKLSGQEISCNKILISSVTSSFGMYSFMKSP